MIAQDILVVRFKMLVCLCYVVTRSAQLGGQTVAASDYESVLAAIARFAISSGKMLDM